MPDTPLFANNILTSLAASLSAGAVTLTVADATGMPTPDVYEYFVITVERADTGEREIMHCTGRTGTSLSVDRAQEGTTAIAFSAGDRVFMALTAGLLEYLRDN